MITQKFTTKSTILDYIANNFNYFNSQKFCEIDALIFSQFCYLNFKNIVPDTLSSSDWVTLSSLYKSELFNEMVNLTLTPDSNTELLKALCSSPRFRDVELNFHENIYNKTTEEQFSATTFKLPTGDIIVAFRGTDLSVTGWKEDFNMCFISPVPSQKSAVAYLDKVASLTSSEITVVGHSKGGNLATFSSAFCSNCTQNRIKVVFNFDGPGFPTDISENSNYVNEHEKVVKIVPEGSIVGVLFENSKNIRIIKSNNFSLLQHDPFSWLIDVDKFISSEKFNNNVVHVDKTLNKWLYKLDIDQRKILVDTVFSIITSINAENIDEFSRNAFKERETIISVLKNVDEDTSNCIKAMFNSYLKLSFDNFFDFDIEKNFNNFINKLLPNKND